MPESVHSHDQDQDQSMVDAAAPQDQELELEQEEQEQEYTEEDVLEMEEKRVIVVSLLNRETGEYFLITCR